MPVLKTWRAAAAIFAAAFAAPASAQEIAPGFKMMKQPDQTIPVVALKAAPKIDGDLADWAGVALVKVPVTAAAIKEGKPTGTDFDVELALGIVGDTIYVAARWPDATEDLTFRPWKWDGKAYRRREDRDDMFAIRFHLGGDYDRCMITEKTYQVDLWLWSAGRSNQLGLAEDMTHTFTTDTVEDAAEYKTSTNKTVYIQKIKDGGDPIYSMSRAPKEKTEETLAGMNLGKPSGSMADVQAKGVWKSGKWTLEMARKLSTGQKEDVTFAGGKKFPGAIAVFDKNSAENKSVSGNLIFDLAGIK